MNDSIIIKNGTYLKEEVDLGVFEEKIVLNDFDTIEVEHSYSNKRVNGIESHAQIIHSDSVLNSNDCSSLIDNGNNSIVHLNNRTLSADKSGYESSTETVMNGSNDNKNNDESTNYETCEIENIMKHEKSEDTGMEVSVEEKASESGSFILVCPKCHKIDMHVSLDRPTICSSCKCNFHFQCVMCDRTFDSAKSASHHWGRFATSGLDCFYCKRPACSKTGQQKHIIKQHSKMVKSQNLTCQTCGTESNSIRAYNHHRRYACSGATRMNCPLCRYSTLFRDDMQKHLTKVHSGDKSGDFSFGKKSINNKSLYDGRREPLCTTEQRE